MEGLDDSPWRKTMARIPWPSTAVNVSILCRRPVQREAYFWWSRGRERGEGGARPHRAAHLSRGPGLPYPPPRYFSLPANATERRRGPTRTLCSWFERVEKWAATDTCFSPVGATTTAIKSHVCKAQILSQILSAAPRVILSYAQARTNTPHGASQIVS